MAMDEPETTGRKPRVGESGAPVGSVLSIVLAVVAVVIGFVILKQINDDSGTSAGGNGGGNGVVPSPGGGGDDDNGNDDPETSEPSNDSTTTTEPAVQNVFKGAKVVVVNSNQQPGSAGDTSEKLVTVGFTMGDAATGVGDEELLEKSRIYINPDNSKARAVAETIARSYGARLQIEEAANVQVLNADGEEATIDDPVVLMLGTDLVDKTPRVPS